MIFRFVFILGELAVLVGVDSGPSKCQALAPHGLHRSLELTAATESGLFSGSSIFLGLGVDELAAGVSVCRLDQDLARVGALAAQGDLDSSGGTRRLGIAF